MPGLRADGTILVLCLVLTAGCQLTEKVIAPGQRTLVVQMVLDRTQARQLAVIEYSSVGDSATSGGGNSRIPPGRPRLPVTAAVATIEHRDGPCAGRVDTLVEQVSSAAPAVPTGTYAATIGCLDPGARLTLRVATTAGEVATGETVIPGAGARTVTVAAQAARFPMDTLRFDRERDTLRVSLPAGSGPGMQVEIRRAEEHDHIAVLLLNDSLGVRLPGNLINPFENDSGETTFRAGAYYVLTVALADANYFDYARSFADPITGRGFLNRLTGGLGVFGSVESANYMLRVGGSVNDAREGVYRFTGRAGNVNLDATLEAYLDDYTGNEFSGFVNGAWVNGAVDVSGDGSFGFSPGLSPDNPNAFQFAFVVTRPTPPTFRRFLLRGVRTPDGSPFPVDLIGTSGNGQTVVRATLSGIQVSGPGS